MPTPKTTAGWLEQAQAGFKYALKAPRLITHIKRLKECEDSVKFFCDSARGIGAHLGTLLFQLPPNLKADLARLEAFLTCLPTDLRAAFEFRHESWLTDDVYGLLERRGVALCIADFGDRTLRCARRRATAIFARRRGLHAGGSGTLGRGADLTFDDLGGRVRVLQTRGGRKGSGIRAGVRGRAEATRRQRGMIEARKSIAVVSAQ